MQYDPIVIPRAGLKSAARQTKCRRRAVSLEEGGSGGAEELLGASRPPVPPRRGPPRQLVRARSATAPGSCAPLPGHREARLPRTEELRPAKLRPERRRAGGAVGLVLRAQGPGQAGWHLLPWLLPTWAAGSSLEGDVLHLGPQGTRQLSAQSHRLASQFLLLCRGVSAQTRHPTKDRGTVIQQE